MDGARRDERSDAGRLAGLRRSYTRAGLDESQVGDDPLLAFGRWLDEALAAGLLAEPNAVVLATADAGGRPSARTVLLKGYDERGFAFYTNLASRKGRELAANPHAALCFSWVPLERQVLVTGSVTALPRADVEAYFRTRPRGSQLSAWASPQSRVVASRAELDRRRAEASARFPDDVPPPPDWGGYRLRPDSIELWQGRPDRLHDRLRWRRDDAAAAGWVRERLAP